MLPTLLVGDHLFVNKFVYGPKVPFTDYRLPGLREPERGDVVVFERSPGRTTPGRHRRRTKRPDLPREDFVKRIVGLPGRPRRVSGRARLRQRRAAVDLDGPTTPSPTSIPAHRLSIQREHLDGCDHAVLDNPRHHGSASAVATAFVPGGRPLLHDGRQPRLTRTTAASGGRCASRRSRGRPSSSTGRGT